MGLIQAQAGLLTPPKKPVQPAGRGEDRVLGAFKAWGRNGGRRGPDRTQKVPSSRSLRPPPSLKDLAIAKPLALPLLWLPARPGCGGLLQGVRGEDKQILSALPSKSSLSRSTSYPFFCLCLVQSHHCSPGPMLSSPAMSPALSVLPSKPEGASEHPSGPTPLPLRVKVQVLPTTHKALQDPLHPPTPLTLLQPQGPPGTVPPTHLPQDLCLCYAHCLDFLPPDLMLI